MSRSRLLLRSALLVAGVLGMFALPARAADDDFEFAQALSRRGYIDLAAEKYKELGTSPEGVYGLALLQAFEARQAAGEMNDKHRKPVPDVLKLFQDADDGLANFLKGRPGDRELEAKLERSKLLQQRADYINLALEQDWVPSGMDKDKLKSQVAEGFDTAINLLRPVEKDLRDRLSKIQDATSDAYFETHGELGLVWLFRLVAMYGKGMALPPGNSAGTQAFTDVVREIEDYLWEYEVSLRGVWALHYRGLCNWKLEKYQDAFGDLRDASTYIENSDDVNQQKVTFDSMVKLSEFALEVGTVDGQSYPALALGVIGKTLEGRWPKRFETANGQGAALAHARLLSVNGQVDAALKIVERVLKEASERGTGMDRQAVEVMASMGSSGASNLSADVLVKVAESFWKQDRMEDAARAYQAVITSCGTDAGALQKFGYPAWDRISLCYANQSRWYACFLACDVLEDAWKASPNNMELADIANESGYRRWYAIDQVARKSKRPEDENQAKAALESFTNDHPDSPRNQDAAGREAESKMKDFKQTPREPREAYLAASEAARKACNAVPANSSSRPKMDAYIIEIERRLDNFDKAIELANAWIGKERGSDTTAAARRAIANGRNIAISNLLVATNQRIGTFNRRQQPEEHKAACEAMLAALTKWGDEFLQIASNGEFTLALWKAEGLVGIGQIDDAEGLVLKVIESAPDNGNTLYLADKMALALLKAAGERLSLASPDQRGAERYYRRAALMREHILNHTQPRDADIILAVAATYRLARDFEKAQGLMEEALRMYDDLKNEAKSTSVRIQLIDLLIDRGEYEKAIPELEARLVEDASRRAEVIGRLKKDIDITPDEMDQMRGVMSNNRSVIDTLSRAYLEAKTKERLIACINLCFVMRNATPRDDWHNEAWVRVNLRLSKALLAFGVDYRSPNSLDMVISVLQNGVFVKGFQDAYDELVPGFKVEAEKILQTAKSERGRM